MSEESTINKHLDFLGIKEGCCVDIGAGDGKESSNSCALYKNGWSGLAVEMDPVKFSHLARNVLAFQNVNLVKCKVTPGNIVPFLLANEIPQDFDFLSLDIDGYDYFVLDRILGIYHPKLICAEINEKIPPPIKFAVKWDPFYEWAGDHFYGQSLSMLYELAIQRGYSLVELNYNNAFLIPSEYNPEVSLTPEEAYRIGYKEKADRKERFSWNRNMEHVLSMSPEDALAFVHEYFKKYKGLFEASI